MNVHKRLKWSVSVLFVKDTCLGNRVLLYCIGCCPWQRYVKVVRDSAESKLSGQRWAFLPGIPADSLGRSRTIFCQWLVLVFDNFYENYLSNQSFCEAKIRNGQILIFLYICIYSILFISSRNLQNAFSGGKTFSYSTIQGENIKIATHLKPFQTK